MEYATVEYQSSSQVTKNLHASIQSSTKDMSQYSYKRKNCYTS